MLPNKPFGRNDMKALLKTVGLAALAVGLMGTAQAENSKIGVVLPYTGVNARPRRLEVDKAFDLYVKLHAKDIAPHTVTLVKRDEGPPSGARPRRLRPSLIPTTR